MIVLFRRVACSFSFFRSSSQNFVFKRVFSGTSFLSKNKKSHNKMFSNNFYIRHFEGSDSFQAVFYCYYKPLQVEREFNFQRKIAEPLDDFLKRIIANIDKIFSNKFKKVSKKKTNLPEQIEYPKVEITVTVDNETFPTSKSCKELFLENSGKNIQFSILGVNYSVVVNSPWVDLLTLPNNIMVGFPVYPNKFELVFANHLNSHYTWYSSKDSNGPWEEIGDGFIYVPTVKDSSSHLKIICKPSNGSTNGPVKEYVSNCKVELGPGPCPFEEGHLLTTNRVDDTGFRVVCYNILADVYAETDVAKIELFPYCPPHALTFDYRKQLYTKEILGYNADIICLQEVDEKVFKNDLQYTLGCQGLKGIYCEKGGTIKEGVTTFFSSNKFRLLDSHRIVLAKEVESNDIFKSVWNQLKSNTAAANSLKDLHAVLQVFVLERIANSKDKLIVANTHLYFHPDADHIRLIQLGLCMEFVKHLSNLLTNQNPLDKYSLIFCGDFNSVPDCGPYQLMTSRHVASDFKDWKSNEKEIIEGVELNQPFSIKSAYGTPQFTNYTKGFKDCLDYIYFQTDHLNLKQVVPLPSEEILGHNTALPSIVFPSDHIPLVADFVWT